MGIVKPTSPLLRGGHPLSRGLILALCFSENGTARGINDYSGYNYQFSWNGTPTWIGGPRGSALNLSVSSYFSFPSTYLRGLSRFTLAMGCYTATTDAGAFFSKNANDLMFQRYSDAKLYFAVNGTTGRAVSAASAVPLGSWVDLAGVYDGSNLIAYQDAAVIASSVRGSTSVPTGTQVAYVNYSGLLAEDSSYDYFYIYNRALSAQDIAQLQFDPFEMFRARRTFIYSAVSPAAATNFRRTLSNLGSRTGSRQAA